MAIKILLIDDNERILKSTKSLLSANDYHINEVNNFTDGIDKLDKESFDIIITDYKDARGETNAGVGVINKLQSTYFSPIIIYTGVLGSIDENIKNNQNNFFKIVEKGPDSDKILLETIKNILESKEFKVKNEIENEIESAFKDSFREYFWDIVHNHWDDFKDLEMKSLKNIMLRRLLKNIHPKYLEGEKVNPVEFYEHPVNNSSGLTTGTILKKENCYYVCVNNDCDLTGNCKLNALIFLKINDYESIIDGLGIKDKESFLNNNKLGYREKSFVLPKTFFFSGGIANFDEIVSLFEIVEGKAVIPEGVEFIARVSQPFLAKLISNFSRFYNRFGTPDIEVS